MRLKIAYRLAVAVSLVISFCTSLSVSSHDDPLPPLATSDAPQSDAATYQAPAPHPLLSDVRVRRAIAYCADRQALIAAAYPYLNSSEQQLLLSDSFIAQEDWLHQSPPLTYTYTFSPTAGQQLLDEAGWTLAPGTIFRTNGAGYELALKFTTTPAPVRLAWAAEFEKQLRDNCGVRLVRFHWPSSIWFGPNTGLFRRDFELGAYAWGTNWPLPLGFAQYGCDHIPTADNLWQGQNYSGWCNPTATSALWAAHLALLKQSHFDQYAIAQAEFAKDAVVMPLFHRPNIVAANNNLSGLQVGQGETIYDWNVHDWVITNAQTITIGLAAGEVLFWNDSANLSARFGPIASLIYGRGLTTFNHDFQARLYDSVPTIENSGAITQTVAVTEGDTVVGIDGAQHTLQVGDQIINSVGTVITYFGGTVSMTQIIVTGAFLPNMRWPDGEPLILADLELWDAVHCDLSAGVYSDRCIWIQGREYLDNRTARYTLYPGYVSPLYSTFLPNAYPSHRVLSDGRTLGEVPPLEWISLPEVTEWPMGLGPYQLIDRQYGDTPRLIFAANPYFALGQPQMPYLEVRLFPYGSLAIVELLAGEVDVIGEDLIRYGTESAAIMNAAQAGLIQTIVYPGLVWEHIDLNQHLYTTIAVKTLPPTGGVISTTLGLQTEFPPTVLTDSTIIILNHLHDPALPLPNSDDHAIRSFSLEAINSAGQSLASLLAPITITINYDEQALISVDSEYPWAISAARLQLAVLDWPQKAWLNVTPCYGCGANPATQQFTARVIHLGEFVLFGNNRLYFPYISNEAYSP